MFRQSGYYLFSANTGQTLTSNMRDVIYTGNGTSTYTYTLPEIGTTGVYGSKAVQGQVITIRNAGSGALGLISVAKHANNTGIYLSSSSSVTSFLVHPGSSVTLIADGSYWYLIDSSNFFDVWDDLEFLTSARASSTNSAVLTGLGATGIEAWQFQPSTTGGSANKWLMCQRQITHGWDKQPIQFHVHFSPATTITAGANSPTSIVITWTFVWRSVHPGGGIAFTDESSLTMVCNIGPSIAVETTKNYNASTGGNNAETTITNGFPSTMILGRLELTSVVKDGVNQSNEMILNGFDAHMKLRKRGTILAFPEP